MTAISAEAQRIKSSLIRDTLDNTPIADKRKAWEDSANQIQTPDQIEIEELLVASVPCLLHTPSTKSSNQKHIVYLHGGGLVEGSMFTCSEWCSRLAAATGYSVLAIDYRLAPEHPYPAAINDTLAVCNAIDKDPRFRGIVSIGADSTGSVLALNALLHRRDSQLTSPKSSFLLSPSVDLSFTASSIKTNVDRDPLVSKEVLVHYAKLYAGSHPLDSAVISPLFAELSNLPAMLIFTDKHELLYEDAIRLCNKVTSFGGEAQLIEVEGLWHVWPTWGDFPEAQLAIAHIVEHIKTYK